MLGQAESVFFSAQDGSAQSVSLIEITVPQKVAGVEPSDVCYSRVAHSRLTCSVPGASRDHCDNGYFSLHLDECRWSHILGEMQGLLDRLDAPECA